MRRSRLIFLAVVVIGLVLIMDVIAGTIFDSSPTDDAASSPEKIISRRKISSSLKERHPALQAEVRNSPSESVALTLDSDVGSDVQQVTNASTAGLRFSTHTHSFIAADALALMNAPDAAIDLKRTHRVAKDPSKCDETALATITDEPAFERYADLFSDIFENEFGSSIPWFLDEGGLIGVSRSGTLRNADDDFDFFALLPNQTAPCQPNTTTCTNEEYHAYIHKFLMVFWNRGLCINKFHPDPAKFKSNMRLMYSIQHDRDTSVPPERCYKEHKPFAHMHLGIMMEDSATGEIETNIWARHTTHPIDKIPMHLVLPTTRCKVGRTEAPCPRDIVGFLKHRNRGEYFKKSADGSCLLIRNRWSKKNRIKAAQAVANLDACGYNTMVSLLPALIASDYTSC